MNLENQRDVAILERRIRDLETTVKQLRDALNGAEFSLVEVGKQGNPTYTQRNRISVGMGVQRGESEELVTNVTQGDILPDGTAQYQVLSWNGTEWIADWVRASA